MSTIGRGIASGLGLGIAFGGVVGAVVATIQMLYSEEVGPILGLLVIMAIGAAVGAQAGAFTGLGLGLVVGIVLNLLLGPVATVPRRTEQIPVVRLAGALVGLLPLAALLVTNEWWPVPVVVALIASMTIAARAPKIAGITVPGGSSIIRRSPFSAEV